MYKSSKRLFRQNPQITRRLEYCVEKLKLNFNVEKIILFGSYARGEVKDFSTIDLLVIADTKLKFFDRIKKALDKCKGGPPSIEPIMYTPSEFCNLLKQGEGFIEDALEEGIVLYNKD
jgi:predicted nucleotidyltransferase